MRWVPLLVAMGLFASACSQNESPTRSDPGPNAEELLAPEEASSSTTTTLRPPTPSDPPEPAATTIGDLEVPCRPSAPGPIEARAGVDDTAITIGTGSDRGGIATGDSGRGTIAMIDALVDYCNSQGGMLGRDLRVVEYDAAAVEAADRVAEACEEVAALVGYIFLQVIETAVAAAQCALPLYPAGEGLAPTSPLGIHGHLVALFADPENAATVVIVGPDTPLSGIDRANRQAAIESIGGPLSVLGNIAYPVDRRPDWDTIVRDARASGAGQVHISGGCRHAVVPFAESASAIGWEPIVVATAAAYDDECLGIVGPERLLIELPFLPFEDGEAAPATAAHGELLDRIAAPRTGDGILAASAFWRWATAAEACLLDGSDTCLERFAETRGPWTAGGLHPAIGADGTTPGCVVVVGIEEGAFVRRVPRDVGTYDCRPGLSVVLAESSELTGSSQ